MDFRAISLILVLSILPIAGCGTVANVARSHPEQGGRSPFGGVRQDVTCIKRAANGELGFRKHPKSESEQYPQFALMAFCAADLPLSLIGDVVTWPYTAAYTFINYPVPTPPVLLAPPTVSESQPMPIPTLPPYGPYGPMPDYQGPKVMSEEGRSSSTDTQSNPPRPGDQDLPRVESSGQG